MKEEQKNQQRISEKQIEKDGTRGKQRKKEGAGGEIEGAQEELRRSKKERSITLTLIVFILAVIPE